jgi:hypothetical protein
MRRSSVLLTLVASLALVGSTRADSFSVGFDNGTLNSTPAIVTFKTSGADMNGMAITFTFTDNSTATSFWVGSSNGLGDSGGVTLAMGGDSYFTQWTLTNASGLGITKMVIDAGLGDTAFDQTFGDSVGTTGSSRGKTFQPTTGKAGLDIVATYSDRVTLGANSPVGDLYRNLTVDFTNQGGLASGKTLKFWADTDSVEPMTVPQTLNTPAPPALVLALLGLPLMLRRRRA